MALKIFNFCHHQWKIVGRDYQGPRAFKFGGGFWGHEQDMIAFGYTTVSLKCKICGTIKTEQVIGRYAENE